MSPTTRTNLLRTGAVFVMCAGSLPLWWNRWAVLLSLSPLVGMVCDNPNLVCAQVLPWFLARTWGPLLMCLLSVLIVWLQWDRPLRAIRNVGLAAFVNWALWVMPL